MAIIESWTKLAGGLYLEGLTVAADGAIWYSDVIGGGVHEHRNGQSTRILHEGRMWLTNGCPPISNGPTAGWRHLLRLNQELKNPSLGCTESCEAITTQLSIEIAHHFIQASPSDTTGGLASWRVCILDERLAARDQIFPTVSELAWLCNTVQLDLDLSNRDRNNAWPIPPSNMGAGKC